MMHVSENSNNEALYDPVSENITVMVVSTSTGSPFRT
jgi:hypothetical protein